MSYQKWIEKTWKIHYTKIKEMRKNLDAPVDTMGCDQLSDEPDDKKVLWMSKFAYLINKLS